MSLKQFELPFDQYIKIENTLNSTKYEYEAKIGSVG